MMASVADVPTSGSVRTKTRTVHTNTDAAQIVCCQVGAIHPFMLFLFFFFVMITMSETFFCNLAEIPLAPWITYKTPMTGCAKCQPQMQGLK